MQKLLLGLAVISMVIAGGACNPTTNDNTNNNSTTFSVTVVKAGSGTGTVTGSGINCGATCSASQASGTTMTLTATPDTGSTFTAWAGCDSTSGSTCTITLSSNKTVSATFDAQGTGYTLTVSKAGTGGGTVTGSGVDCGVTCSKSYPAGTSVTLTANANANSILSSWTGCDSSSGTSCTVAMNANKAVTATFDTATAIQVTDDITTPTTWATGNVYEITKYIRVTSALTIQPGVRVLFDEDASLDVSGTLNVDGQSATTPVVFTSAKATPAGGDWNGIKLRASGSTLKYCEVLYAGGNDSPALTIADGFTATVTNCTFAHHVTSRDSMAEAAALDASGAAAGTLIKDNLFFDNRIPLMVNTTFNVESQSFDNSAAAPGNPQANKYNAVFVAGCAHVKTTITWPALPVPYVIGDPNTACNYVTVDTAAQLILGSATATAIVKFHNSGSLDAAGILNAHAIFTSMNDDANGGDTNGNGTATSPAPRDWDVIKVKHNASTLENCKFLYAGGDDNSSVEVWDGINVSVTGCTFAHNRSETESVTSAPALNASGAGATTVIQNNVFFDNTVPLSVSTLFSIDDSNTFNDGATAAVQNTYQAVIIAGCGHIKANITWSLIKVPLLIGDPNSACNYVAIDANAHLTLADNTIVKFFNSGSVDVHGTLTAVATTGIVFTSWADDAHGGDTNADGAATTATAGDWDGIDVSVAGSTFEKVSFLYGGGAVTSGDYAALSVSGNKAVSVKNCVFAHNKPSTDSLRAVAALDLTNAASNALGTVVTGNRFFDNMIPLAINTKISLDDSNFFDSGVAGSLQPSRYNGIIVDGCGHVTAATNWNVTKVPFVIGDPVTACNYIAIDGAGHLTLGPNLVMKFFLEGNIDVAAAGSLTIDPTDYLTSIADDYLNDTNADGSASTPVAGGWHGIKYGHTSGPDTCDGSAYMHYFTPNLPANACAW